LDDAKLSSILWRENCTLGKSYSQKKKLFLINVLPPLSNYGF
jgi:hypothetical protein